MILFRAVCTLRMGERVFVLHELQKMSIRGIATTASGYRSQTMRWYGKQVLMKVGCRQRAELARRVSRALASLFPSFPDITDE